MPKLNRAPRVYLSPAYHWFNNCSIAGCDETTHNNMYLDEVEPFLDACGIEWKRGPRRVPKSNESGTDLMIAAVKESDAFGADIHYVSHTNAIVEDVEDVGNGKAQGCRPIIYEGSQRGEALAKFMVARRREVYPGKVTLNRRKDLYELRVPNAVSFYEEHVFHDNMEDAQWFHDHMRDVARSAVQGMCDYFEIPFVDPYYDYEAPATTCLLELPILSKGCEGNSVKAFQLLLEGNNCSCGTAGADGDFGNATQGATQAYQREQGLTITGTADAATWYKLLM